LSLSRSLTSKCANRGKSTVVAAIANINKPLASSPMLDTPIDHDDHSHEDEHFHWSLPERRSTTAVTHLGQRLYTCKLGAVKSLSQTSVRHAHTDVEFPNMDNYRNSYTKDPNVSAKDTYYDRHTYSYVATTGSALLAVYFAKAAIRDIVAFIAPSADVLAMGKVEVKLSDIPEGKNAIIKWRGKPLFVRHRSQAEIERERAVDLASLRDPQTDETRVKNPKWLVIIGICTHLGCVPIANAGEYHGYFCPCHGSHYDASGRIRKGPAPLNLEVPPYEFTEEELLVVG